jgi:DNA-binding winged helix-turn-helix (wHTH) protein/TolB-like protein
MDISIKDRGVFAFGPFRLDPLRRTLRRDGATLKLSPRLFDTLLLLVEHAGQLVEKDELLAQVWGGRIVEESNLSRAIFELRKVLQSDDADGYIVTAPGRGYRFAAAVRLESGGPEPAVMREAPVVAPSIPTAPIEFTQISSSPPVAARPLRRRVWALAGAACVVAVAGLMFGVSRLVAPAVSPAPRLSLVVLPFGGAGAAADLADALRDDLTTDLSHIPGSLVIARQSADAVAAKGLAAGEIGRALNVRYLLSGSLRAEGGARQVNAQLVDAASGRQIWAQRFDLGAGPVWQAEAGIVHQITSALDGVLVEAEVARADSARPHDEDALDLFFRARALIRRDDSLATASQAQAMLEAAVKKQPDFVEALAELGLLLVHKETAFEDLSWAQDKVEAESVIAHGLVVAPHNDTILVARGRMLQLTGHYAEAELAYAAASTSNPGNVQALMGQAVCAWSLGQLHGVVAPAEAAMRLDPQGRTAMASEKLLGLAALFSGDGQRALPHLQRYNAMHGDPTSGEPNLTPVEEGRVFLIAAYALAGDIASARERYQSYKRVWPNRSVWRLLAYFTPEERRLPDFEKVAGALVAAGMPRFADLQQSQGLSPQGGGMQGGAFTATPAQAGAAETIDTLRLRQMLAGKPVPIIVDTGRGVAVPPNAIMLTDAPDAFTPPAMTEARLLQVIAGDAAIVVMDDGGFGIEGYNAATRLAHSGGRKIYWYRGGEEAWAADGLPGIDRRAE